MAQAQAKSNADKSRIKRRGVVSKGQRRSSIKAGGTKKNAIIVVAERIATNMREAFLNMTIINTEQEGSVKQTVKQLRQLNVVNAVMQGIKHNTGNNKVGRGWSANLSPRTIRTLTEQGIFA